MKTTTSIFKQQSLCQPCSGRDSAQFSGSQTRQSVWRASHTRKKLPPVQAGFDDAAEFIKDLFDFEKWAPRSSQAWRLGVEPAGLRNTAAENKDSITEDDVDILNQRINSSRQSMGSMDLLELSTLPESETPSFLQSTDAELSDALNSRITQISTTTASPFEESSTSTRSSSQPSREMLTGPALAELVFNKFDKWHDVGIVRRDIPGKTLVTLNIYHAHLGQRSFPMTEEDFKEKMDGIAALIEIWGKAEVVIDFMNSPVKSKNGLPSRPIVGNAVAIPLDLSNEQIAEWFAR